MFRFDASQPGAPRPVIADIIPAEEVRRLMRELADRNIGLSEVAERIVQYPALARRILAMANSSLSGARTEITEPAHGMSMLGSRRLLELLAALPAEPNGDRRLTEIDRIAAA